MGDKIGRVLQLDDKRGPIFGHRWGWVFHTQESTWKVSKGKDVLDCVVGREKRKGMASEPRVKCIVGTKEIGAFTLARRSLPSKETWQVWYY